MEVSWVDGDRWLGGGKDPRLMGGQMDEGLCRQRTDGELGEWMDGQVNDGRGNGETTKSWADDVQKSPN